VTRRLVPLCVLYAFAALWLAACGGGGSSSGSVPSPAPTTPNPQGTLTATLPTGGGTLTLPGAGGYSASMLLTASAPAGVTATIVTQTTLPPQVPPLMRFLNGRRHFALPTEDNTLLFAVTMSLSAATTMDGFPGFTFMLPSDVSNAGPFWLAYYDPSNQAAGWQAVLGPGTVSGQTVTLLGSNSQFGFAAHTTYVFALYVPGPPTPSPSPTPSPTPTPTDIPQLAVTPFPLATNASVGGNPVLGSDGNMWFAQTAGSVPSTYSMDKLAASGAITAYPVTGSGTNGFPPRYAPASLGPDGAVWFVYPVPAGSVMMGRIDTSGNITSYSLPGVSYVYSMVEGTDGNLWFISDANNLTAFSPSSRTIVAGLTIPAADGSVSSLSWNSADGTAVLGTSDPAGFVDVAPGSPPTIARTYQLPGGSNYAMSVDTAAGNTMYAYADGPSGSQLDQVLAAIDRSSYAVRLTQLPQTFWCGAPCGNQLPTITTTFYAPFIAGPDGNLYFWNNPNGQGSTGTGFAALSPGALALAFALEPFPSTKEFLANAGFAVGADGNVWNATACCVYRITPLGPAGSKQVPKKR